MALVLIVNFKGDGEKVWRFYTNDVYNSLDILYKTFKNIDVYGMDSEGTPIFFN